MISIKIHMLPFLELESDLKLSYINDFVDYLEKGAIRDDAAQKKFEHEMEKLHGFNYALAVASGTSALRMSIKSMELDKGSYAITTPFTYQATASSILDNGLKLKFCDIDLSTLQMSMDDVKKEISSEVSLIVPVHMNGNHCDISALNNEIIERGLKIVEDSAQMLPLTTKQYNSYSDAICLSLGPSKNMSGLFEAGMVMTNNEEIYNDVKIMSKNGNKGSFSYPLLGENAKIDPFACVILLRNIKYVSAWNKRRKEIAEKYDSCLSNIKEVSLIKRNKSQTNSKYTILVSEKRNDLLKYLSDIGIEAGIFYPSPLHLEKFLNFNDYSISDLPNSEEAAERAISLPIHQYLTDVEVEYISEKVRWFYEK